MREKETLKITSKRNYKSLRVKIKKIHEKEFFYTKVFVFKKKKKKKKKNRIRTISFKTISSILKKMFGLISI